MRSRYGTLVIYTTLLACVAAGWLLFAWMEGIDFPAWWICLLGVGVSLFVWQFGLPAPRLGLMSMERLPQIGMLLIFEPAVAASICAAASMAWPFISRRYSQGSFKVAALRGIHNASMTVVMLMLGGAAYLAIGGRHPLTGMLVTDIWSLIVLALIVQIVNVGMMTLFFHFDGRDVRRIITPGYALSDLIFVPAGILAAVLFNGASPTEFALFAALMLLFVLSFNSMVTPRDPAQPAGVPFTRLFEAGLALKGARRIDDLAARIRTETRALFRFDELYLVLVDRERRVLDIRMHERHQALLPARIRPIDSGLFGWLVSRAQPLLVTDWRDAPAELLQRADGAEKTSGGSLLAVPLVNDGIVLGLLSVHHSQPGTFAPADMHLMKQLGEHVAGALADTRAFEDLESYRRHLEERVAERTVELEKANTEKERLINMLRERSQRLERESQEDPLTGVANRRCFMQRLSSELEVALAVGQPLSIAIADLDHFKVVNDELGHPVGDQALRQAAALMRRSCRHSDLVARIGGEEFALILPGMTRADATVFCETLRESVATHEWHSIHPELGVTISIGLAQWDGSAELDELVHAADAQLYRAKRAGRNQVA